MIIRLSKCDYFVPVGTVRFIMGWGGRLVGFGWGTPKLWLLREGGGGQESSEINSEINEWKKLKLVSRGGGVVQFSIDTPQIPPHENEWFLT